jgi:hypothetical protein
MGITFTTIEPKSQEVLDMWLANLRKRFCHFPTSPRKITAVDFVTVTT